MNRDSKTRNIKSIVAAIIMVFAVFSTLQAQTNNIPTMDSSAVTVNPPSVDRFGPGQTVFSATFADIDTPGVDAFLVTFRTRSPYNSHINSVAEALGNGVGGMTIVYNGDSTYTASFAWDPPDNSDLGYHDLYCEISDGIDTAIDGFDNNTDELLVGNGGENAPPVVPADNTFASPAGIERVGPNTTTISATFSDPDMPGSNAFWVSFKLRYPDDLTELVLADSVTNGQGGVTITDDGSGIYTASIQWDPSDTQDPGYYDLYFQVTDGINLSIDGYSNNLDELQIFDPPTNNAPTITAGATFVVPSTVNNIGSEYTMVKSTFTDIDMPGSRAFVVTISLRDAGGTEYPIVSAAYSGEQGLRIENKPGGIYELSAIWNPPDNQPAGLYDLYFSVQDNNGASAADGYADNLDELTIVSTAILGDGNLLHRTNNADNCGGPNSACHNIANHQAFDCLTCHAPHSATNIYMVRDTIQTPNSGNREVIFKTLGIGDAFNSPDPVPGDPTSGVMADDSDGVFTGVCEVCHTATSHHRNDGTQPYPAHHNAESCIECHPHTSGFNAAESGGGVSCTCHNSLFTAMDSTSVAHRHILANTEADYSPGAVGMFAVKNCLSCHVDHDIFRPDLNVGIGQRASNLRVDWAIDPIPGSSGVLANSDYSSAGSGGICLSCHAGPDCSGCHSSHLLPPNDPPMTTSFAHTFINKVDFDAATQTHNYSVSSFFPSDGSSFNANCVKCHNDDMSKGYQSSTYEFSAHASEFEKMLDTTGIVAPSSPLEEKFCFKCHSTISNPNSGSNLDFFGVQNMTNQNSLEIETAFSRTYSHPTLTYSGRHSMADSALSFGDTNRHAECEDCHSPHAALQGTHDGSSNLVSNALKGSWGVEPTAWPAQPNPTNNGNVFAAPTSYNTVDPAQREYQICLKCHSNYTTLPTGARNLAEEINPNNASTHGIAAAGTNSYCNASTMFEPWASSGVAWCSDCHRSDNPSDPEGPHGSNLEHLLVATTVSSNSAGTPLCFVCHRSTVYWSGSGYNNSNFDQHPSRRSAHKSQARNKGCFACHMWDYASRPGLGVQTVDDLNAGTIFVHGQNKRWVYNEQSGGSGSGQYSEAFINGYVANISFTSRTCWSEQCHVHQKNY